MDVLLNTLQTKYGLKSKGVPTCFKDLPIGHYFHNWEGEVFKKVSKGKIRPLGKSTEMFFRRNKAMVFDLGESL